MALALGVKNNDIVYVGDVPVTVVETRGFESAVVEVGMRVYSLTDQKSVEILPQVFVSCGKPDARYIEKHERLVKAYNDAIRYGGTPPPNPGSLLPRLIFEAPREIVILRGELYEAAKHVPLARA